MKRGYTIGYAVCTGLAKTCGGVILVRVRSTVYGHMAES
jgi:hypothetical protein